MINDLTLCRRQKLDIVVPVRPVKFYGYSFPISFVFGVIPYSFGTVHCITITETNCRPLTRCHALKQKRFTVWIYYRHESSIKTPHAVKRLAWLLLSLVSPTWRTSGGCWIIVTSVHTLYSGWSPQGRFGHCGNCDRWSISLFGLFRFVLAGRTHARLGEAVTVPKYKQAQFLDVVGCRLC